MNRLPEQSPDAQRRNRAVDVAHVSVPRAGEIVNGDRAISFRWPDGRALFGVIDGLGHGHGAHDVSRAAAEYLSNLSAAASIRGLMEGLHDHLSGSRGAAATLCLLIHDKLEVCAVGNVELRCVETQVPLMFSPGILGMRVQKFRCCEAVLKPRSRIVIFSDGISTRLRHEELRPLPPQEACKQLVDRYRRAEDDATVMVADVE
jgi:negative regulator of sigma-B (phosphoserine phosphatase)